MKSNSAVIVRYQLLSDPDSQEEGDQIRVAELLLSLASVKLYVQPSCDIVVHFHTQPKLVGRYAEVLKAAGFTGAVVRPLDNGDDEEFARTIQNCQVVDRICIRRMLCDFRDLPTDRHRLLLGTDVVFLRPPQELLAEYARPEPEARVMYMWDDLFFRGFRYKLRYCKSKILEGLVGDFYSLGPGVTLSVDSIKECLRMIDAWPTLRRWLPTPWDIRNLCHACDQQTAAILLAQFPSVELPREAYTMRAKFDERTAAHHGRAWEDMRYGQLPAELRREAEMAWKQHGCEAIVVKMEARGGARNRFRALGRAAKQTLVGAFDRAYGTIDRMASS